MPGELGPDLHDGVRDRPKDRPGRHDGAFIRGYAQQQQAGAEQSGRIGLPCGRGGNDSATAEYVMAKLGLAAEPGGCVLYELPAGELAPQHLGFLGRGTGGGIAGWQQQPRAEPD